MVGEWGYTMIAAPVTHTGFQLLIVLLSLLYIVIAVIVGAYFASIIDASPETIAGYSVFQLFFAIWFFRDFWTTGYIWYKPLALFLVIPCAILGQHWGRRSDREFMVRQAPRDANITRAMQ